MKQLRYAYISSYKNIKQQGFNFSAECRFHYNLETKILTIEDRSEKIIPGFFDDHYTSITAIVGENGAGKSNLIEWLLMHLASFGNGFALNFPNLSNELIILDKVIFKTKDLILENQEGLEGLGFEIKEYEDNLSNPYGHPLFANKEIGNQYIYFSHFFDLRATPERLSSLHDISTNDLLISDKFYSLAGHDQQGGINSFPAIEAFADQEVSRHLDFISENIQDLPFTLPNRIFFEIPKLSKNRFLNISNELLDDLNEIDFWIEMNEFEASFNTRNESKLEKFQYILTCSLLRAILVQYPEEFLATPPDSQFFNDWVFGGAFPAFGGDALRESFQKAQEVLKCFDSLIETVAYGLNEKKRTDYHPEKTEWEVSNEVVFVVDDASIDSLREFHKNLREVTRDRPIMLNYWGNMSTGERNLLNLFSRLFSLKNIGNDGSIGYSRPYHFVLFIDEGTSGYHPAWQKEYFKTIHDYLPKILCKGDTEEHDQSRIQLILVSHSPFVVSNLPSENIVFLKKDEDGSCQVVDGLEQMKQTFGANIHTLLSDSFFLKGLIGDFAQDKIDEVLSFIEGENPNMNLDKARRIADLVGEPIIQKYLIQRLDSMTQDSQIAQLKARIAELEGTNNNQANDQD